MPSVGGKKNFQSFTVICRKPHVASSICLRATIFQNPEGTLWTHCILCYNSCDFSTRDGVNRLLLSDLKLHYKSYLNGISDYGGETDVSLNCGRFYGPIVRPQMRMNK
jgi:hypothetical protein